MEKLWQVVRHSEDILSTRAFSSRRRLIESLERLDARQRYYIRETLERARLLDRSQLVHLVTLKFLVNHWEDQDTATRVATLWCVDSLAATQFTRAVLRESPHVCEILNELRARVGSDGSSRGDDMTTPQEETCTRSASHSS